MITSYNLYLYKTTYKFRKIFAIENRTKGKSVTGRMKVYHWMETTLIIESLETRSVGKTEHETAHKVDLIENICRLIES